jgi:hypothetical protein
MASWFSVDMMVCRTPSARARVGARLVLVLGATYRTMAAPDTFGGGGEEVGKSNTDRVRFPQGRG